MSRKLDPRGWLRAGVALLLLLPGAASAQPAAQSRPSIDPKAMEALNRMGHSLQSLTSFQASAETTVDEVLESGQKVQLSRSVRVLVRRPDHLFAQLRSDRKDRDFYYDGRTFTMVGRRAGYYATVPAPPTIRELVTTLTDLYGVELPLADLFLWGTSEARPQDIRSATYIGPSRVGDAECDQYAYRQTDVDWQVWIERGPRALPRKVVITTTSDPAQPAFTSELSWNLAAPVPEGNFHFVAPPGMQKIELVPRSTERR